MNRYAQVLSGDGSAEQAVKRIESVLNKTIKGQPFHALVNSLRESSRTANTEQKVFESKIAEAPNKTPVKQNDSKVNEFEQRLKGLDAPTTQPGSAH